MMNRRNRLRRGALLLALLVVAAIDTGVAASAATTVVPKQLTGTWGRGDTPGWMVVSTRGKVEINAGAVYHAKFSRVTTHRLTVSGVPSCSGMGTYGWTITKDLFGGDDLLKLKKIHDACKRRVNLLTDDSWGRLN
jgi:hypothetical protein